MQAINYSSRPELLEILRAEVYLHIEEMEKAIYEVLIYGGHAVLEQPPGIFWS